MLGLRRIERKPEVSGQMNGPVHNHIKDWVVGQPYFGVDGRMHQSVWNQECLHGVAVSEGEGRVCCSECRQRLSFRDGEWFSIDEPKRPSVTGSTLEE